MLIIYRKKTFEYLFVFSEQAMKFRNFSGFQRGTLSLSQAWATFKGYTGNWEQFYLKREQQRITLTVYHSMKRIFPHALFSPPWISYQHLRHHEMLAPFNRPNSVSALPKDSLGYWFEIKSGILSLCDFLEAWIREFDFSIQSE